jgi:hypothetical protein
MTAQVVRQGVRMGDSSIVRLDKTNIFHIVQEIMSWIVMLMMLGRDGSAATGIGKAVHVGDPRVLTVVVVQTIH